MAVNPLPPQAFTKETLQKAYTWLLTQSPSIKEMASTQDMLISLYLKAQRNGDASLDTPSIQNFKQELKSLAGIMGDLQTPPAGAQASNQSVSHVSAPSTGPSYTHTVSQSAPSATATNSLSGLASMSLAQLDAVSLQALADVKLTLNLSSEIEALRALIALGHKHFKKIHT
jgi:hypothetical protein